MDSIPSSKTQSKCLKTTEAQAMSGGQSSSRFEESDGNSLLLNVPEDLLIEILVRVPASDIVKSCVRVSQHLRSVIASPTLWRTKCELEGKYIAGKTPVPEDFKKLYFFHPYTRNLIVNPCALEGLNHWDIIQEGGDDFLAESSPSGSRKVSETDMLTEWTGPEIKNWATSYYACEKRQIIHLIQEGVEVRIMDELKPPIYISEWFAARFDCACHYELEVKLLTGKKKVVDKFIYRDDIPQWTNGDWQKVEHVFENYDAGVRLIEFRHLGNDKQFWAGHYGSKFTLSTVKFRFQNSS